MIDLSDARPLRPSEVTPELTAAAARVLDDPTLVLGDVVMVAEDIVARVETHTNPTATNPAPHPHRGVTLYHIGPHAVAPAPEGVEGIDLSSYQPVADFERVASSGRSFAYIRSGDGFYDDPVTEYHYRDAGGAGLARGLYHLLRASRSSSDQVAHFLERTAALEAAHGRAELPPCLDVELADGVDLPGVAAAVTRALESLSAGGRRPVIYTMPGFWDSLPAIDVSGCDLWVAHWGVSSPTIPCGWDRAVLWQYASTATVPGVGARMDVDRWLGDGEIRAWGYAASFV